MNMTDGGVVRWMRLMDMYKYLPYLRGQDEITRGMRPMQANKKCATKRWGQCRPP